MCASLDARGEDVGGCRLRRGGQWRSGGEAAAKASVSKASGFDERAPDGVHQVMPYEEAPKAIRAFIEIRHGEIGCDGAPIFRAAAPNRGVREEALVNPGIAPFEFFGRHVLGAEDGMRRVVERPFGVQQTALGFHLAKERSGGIRREDVKRGAFEAILFDPIGGAGEDVFRVVIEAEDEGAVDLNAVVMEEADAAGVFGRFRSFLFGVGEIFVGERFEADKYAGASRERHLADERGIIGDVDRDCGAPDFFERTERAAKAAQVFAIRTEIIVNEDGVGLIVGFEFRDDLRRILHTIRHAQAVCGEVAEAAAIMAAARGDEAGGGKEARARQNCAARWRIAAIVGFVICAVGGTEATGFDVGENLRPELDAVADGECVGMRRAFGGAGEHVQTAQNHFAAARAIPASEFESAPGEGEVHGDADDFRSGRGGRAAVEQIFIPILYGPVRRSGGCKTGEGESGGEDVFAKTGVRIFGIEGIDEEHVARADGLGGECMVEKRGFDHIGGAPMAARVR